MAAINFIIPDTLHRAFKLYCASKGVTMKSELHRMILERVSRAKNAATLYDIPHLEQMLREKGYVK